jgi:hypothetical protein
MSMGLKRFTLSADKKILILVAGSMWCGVGIMLIRYAILWLSSYNGSGQGFYYGAGFIAAMPIHHFGFLKIADKNINRLMSLTEKKCIFSFMTWKSYIIVVIMVSMGIGLRHSDVPKQYLSILYIGIGLALFLSGIRYFRFFFKLLMAKRD